MEFYTNKNQWKLVLFLTAVLIGAGTLLYTETFLKELRKEERRNLTNVAEALRIVQTAEGEDLTFTTIVLQQNVTVPLVLVDEDDQVIYARNIDEDKVSDQAYMKKRLAEMAKQHDPIVVSLEDGVVNYLYYSESILLKKLRVYPLVLLAVIGLFVFIAYMAFSNARKSEQNRVWTGMAKETAHQIGTPLTSMLGWIALLRNENKDSMALNEMEKDIQRLQVITDRFSKIGSQPELKPVGIVPQLEETVDYLKNRISKKIQLSLDENGTEEVIVNLNPQLFSWVIENLIRNAVDAINGEGRITIQMRLLETTVQMDISDSGKGIPLNKTKAIFRPGYTTKQRGWGLGLSLAKRIIEEYHQGKIFVAHSEMKKGTTFRIILPLT